MSLGLSAPLGARFGQRAVLLPSLVLFAGGLLLLARTPAGHASYVVDILPPILLMGVAFGLAMPSLMTLGMSDAGPADSGLISGVFNTSQQIGGALGLAVLASLASTRTDHLLAGHHGQTAALTGGYHLAFLIAAGLVTAAAVLAAVLLRSPVHSGPADGDPAAYTAEAGSDAEHSAAAAGQAAPAALSASPGTRPAPERADRRARA